MKKREKILAAVVGGMLGVVFLAVFLRGFFTKPLKELDNQTRIIREKLMKVNNERRDYFTAEDALRKVAQRAFSTDYNEASARSGEMITRQIALAGLSESDFTRLPVGPRKMRGASEIGWSVQGKGDLNRVVNLLFLLKTSPYINRLESVTLTAYDKPGEIRVRFVYFTIVLEPSPEFDPIELKPRLTLESPERLAYNSILDRDLLRPYIKAPPPPPPASPPPNGGAPTAAPGPESWRVVSLSEWEGQPEAHLRDNAGDKTLRFKPGDQIKDHGEVVAIDYRPLPLPRNPLLVSDSRLVLKIGEEFWAVERGQTLGEKRRLDNPPVIK